MIANKTSTGEYQEVIVAPIIFDPCSHVFPIEDMQLTSLTPRNG